MAISRLLFIALASGLLTTGCQTANVATASLEPVARVAAVLPVPLMPIPVSSPMPGGSSAPAPEGFVSFCVRSPDQCAEPAAATETLGLTQANWMALVSVNDGINQATHTASDAEMYGVPEYWTVLTTAQGDCEDYALTKRKLLIEAGIPAQALRIAVVITPTNTRHAVLTVATDRGDYVLDSANTAVLPWAETGYIWLERQAAANPRDWVALNAMPRVAMADTGTATGAH